nr:metallopeptidase family protein [uncultured Hyphomonas sp.]
MSMFDQTAPTAEDILALAEACVAGLPQHMQTAAREVRIIVEDYAEDEILQRMKIRDALGLSGLYSGVPLIHESVTHPSMRSPLVYLFRLPILFEWAARGDVTLEELVSHVTIHEYGHHFGWSDDEMHRLLDSLD